MTDRVLAVVFVVLGLIAICAGGLLAQTLLSVAGLVVLAFGLVAVLVS